MNASTRFFSLLMVIFLTCGAFVSESAAGSESKKGFNFVLTSGRISPKEFSKGYAAEKKENARLLKKSRRKMHHKQNGWKLWRFFTENQRRGYPIRFE